MDHAGLLAGEEEDRVIALGARDLEASNVTWEGDLGRVRPIDVLSGASELAEDARAVAPLSRQGREVLIDLFAGGPPLALFGKSRRSAGHENDTGNPEVEAESHTELPLLIQS